MGLHVVVAGGGTAGHVEPALNVADALRAIDPSATVTALGTAEGLETRLVPARGYELDIIDRVPLPRRPTADLFTLPWRMRRAVTETRAILQRRQADVLVGFGGYVAMPAYLAARNRVPIVIHEANARAGLANRVGRRFTPYVAEAVAGSLPGAIRVGIPLRASVAALDRAAGRSAARRMWNVDADSPCLLVFGGSQGARNINQAVVGAVTALAESGIHVIHAHGEKNADQITVEHPNYHPVPYIDDMAQAYCAADFVICRAGAMTCAELSAVGLPALYVPLPIGNGEQRLNALPTVNAGGGRLVDDRDLTPQVVESLTAVLNDPAALSDMSAKASAEGVRDAAQRVADLVIAAAGGRRS